MFGYHPDTVSADRRSAAAWADIAKDRNDQERLFGRIKKMEEEIAVYMPVIELPERDFALPLLPEIDDKAIFPLLRCVGYAIFPPKELADRAPRLRCKFRYKRRIEGGQVGSLSVPGRLSPGFQG